jgi:predicted DNA-binding ribbon-helix-helix protein
VAAIDTERRHRNLSSAIRLFVLEFYKSKAFGESAAHEAARAHLVDRPGSA